MGKRGASAAAASGADDGNHVDEAEADDLMVRLARWRSEHPTRDYVGAPIEQQAAERRLSQHPGVLAAQQQQKSTGLEEALGPRRRIPS